MNVIFVFRNYQGIGDNIRGLINLLQIKKIINKKINIYIDFSVHALNKYIINTLPDDLKVNNNYINSFVYGDENNHDNEIINLLLNHNNEYVYISSNNYPHQDNITEDIKQFIKNIFVFNNDFEKLLNESLNKLPTNYDIYHYRIGDEVFYNDINKFDNIINSFNNRKNSNNIFLISDSLNLKTKIYEIYKNNKVFVFLNKPKHTQYDSNNIEDTIIDFILVTKAKNIYCYSNYRWISNFILWTSYIYDINLVNLK